MPVYHYFDEETGLRIDVRRTVADRNKPITLKRDGSVPNRLSVIVPGATESGDFNRKMLRAYHKKEEREGARFKSEHSKEKIKAAWEN